MLWAAYALPVLLKVLRGLKNSWKDAPFSVYTEPITCLRLQGKPRAITCVFTVNKSKRCFVHSSERSMRRLQNINKITTREEERCRRCTVKLNGLALTTRRCSWATVCVCVCVLEMNHAPLSHVKH